MRTPAAAAKGGSPLFVGVGVATISSEAVTGVVVPASTWTSMEKSRYPCSCTRIVWLPDGIPKRVTGVVPRYTLSTKTLPPEGAEVTDMPPPSGTGVVAGADWSEADTWEVVLGFTFTVVA